MIVILGATATGKSDIGVKLAKKLNGEIISADSRQVYKGMDIGAGKISAKEMQGIPHYLLNCASPKRKFTIAQYQAQTIDVANKILRKKKVPFLVGGSPLYIYSIVKGWQFPKLKADLKLRKTLEKKDIAELFSLLKKLDSRRAAAIEQKNKRRLIRAIEIAKHLGKVPPLKTNPKFDCLLLGLKLPKEILKEKIKKRLSRRFEKGMIKEVAKLNENGVSWKRFEELGLEYKWIARFLKKEISKEKMKGKLQKDIEQFARRQMVWFKKDKSIKWIKNRKEALKLSKEFLEQN